MTTSSNIVRFSPEIADAFARDQSNEDNEGLIGYDQSESVVAAWAQMTASLLKGFNSTLTNVQELQ